MSAMKRFAEDVSVEMGFEGEINDEVLIEAQRRLIALNVISVPPENSAGTIEV